ncbi:2Fe-2S iron-sulfur cluster binding domain-containing protein [Hymenobacter gummosus]|uniref:2Fe-2S iron-sulfur cluster binding domain-containing protein n=1 Tax=Hymenobacter gummosus TaxID=1776032 RepID=A0A431TV14_9BACT|nr:2Fe-2S iron-sulfur cluster-binding protein [Hymenobacter gummosus]RTQ45000.1 2Fe-2S iron-sulfur cluster binding domain-containing protein [Hymenobacter gummosus]
MKAVNITFKFSDGQPEQTHVAAEGESVLDVALNNGIQLQHNCGGVCGCSTCHVYVQQGGDELPEISDKEEDFIDRAVNPRLNSRLACQCVIQSATENLVIEIPKQDFLGH